jgi:hypothetical protein
MSNQTSESLFYRSEFLFDVFTDLVDKEWSVLEIGQGDGRNVRFLNERGYHAEGIDKNDGNPIETFPEKEYDVIYSMATFFLIPPENNWVFEKIARMAKKFIITIEGETSADNGVWGRNYAEMFKPFGFEQIYQQTNVFNQYGVLRIMKRNGV